MSARVLLVGATLAGVAMMAGIRLWPAAPEHSAAAPPASPPNRSWSRAAALNTPPAAPLLPAADPDTDDEKGAESAGSEASQALSRPQPHAVTMQDGTVLWAADRERIGSAPARER